MKDASSLQPEISARVRAVREHFSDTQEAFCQLSGLNKRSLQSYERQLSVPGGEALRAFVKLGVDVNWLLTGEGEMFTPARYQAAGLAALGGAAAFIEPPGKNSRHPEAGNATVLTVEEPAAAGYELEIVEVPYFDQRASAGHGAEPLAEAPARMVSFDRTWLRQETRVPPHRLAMLPVSGSSMEPDLHDGDVILIDRGDIDQVREGVYVFALGGGVFVKRLVLRGTALMVVSSNSHFEAVELATMREEPSFCLIGRVIGKPEIRRV